MTTTATSRQDRKADAPGIASAKLLTIDEFRRRYFSKTARPSRRVVRGWISFGTSEGVRLRGYRLDSTFFVDAEGVAEFLELTRLATKTVERPARRSTASAEARACQAINTLKREFGF